MSIASAAQLSAIHALKKAAGLDDPSYRDFLERETGERSSKDLSSIAAGQVIEGLKTLSEQAGVSARPTPRAVGALRLEGPYAGVCRALWISGYELGVFEHREDTALAAFVRRQTRLDSLNWVRDAQHARSVLEALKDWIAREAEVCWPSRGHDGPEARKAAVIAAQLRILGETIVPEGHDLDRIIRELGRRVRRTRSSRQRSKSRA